MPVTAKFLFVLVHLCLLSGGASLASVQQSKTPNANYVRYVFSHPTHTNWWALCSKQCVNNGLACGLLVVHHGIYSNPADMEWLMLRGRQEDAFKYEGDRRFCLAFVKSKNVAWQYSACNEDVDFVVDVVDTCVQHAEMRVDPMRVGMHGFSSGGIFSLHNSNAFSKLGSRVKSFVIYGSNNIQPECNFMQGHLLMVHGEQDRVVKWGSHYESTYSTCGTRKIVTRVAALRGYSVTADEASCAENCDRYYNCYAERSKVAQQTWAGITKYFGDCGSDGTFLDSACNVAAVLQCARCYPESPCSTHTTQPPTAAATSSMKLTNLDGADDTTVFKWGGNSGCEGVVEHWRIRDWNHDYPNRQENGQSTRESAFWARMREWLWSNSGHSPSGCSYEARYRPSRSPPSCSNLCTAQSKMDWCASASAGYGIGTQLCGSWAAASLCPHIGLGHAAVACCSNSISPSTPSTLPPASAPTPSPPTASPSNSQSPMPTPVASSPTPVPSFCPSSKALNPSPVAGYSCEGVSGIDSNFGGTSAACSNAGGSWVTYTCKTASDYWLGLPQGSTADALQQAWEPKCCIEASPTPPPAPTVAPSLCPSGNQLDTLPVAGHSCVGVSGIDSNFGGTASACQNAGGSWETYTCQAANEYWLAQPTGDAKTSLQQVWEPKCCRPSPSPLPEVTPTPTAQPSPMPPSFRGCPSQCIAPLCHWSGFNGPGWDASWSADGPDDKRTENGVCKHWCKKYTTSQDAAAGDRYFCGDGSWHRSGIDCRLCTDQSHAGIDSNSPLSRCSQPGANQEVSIGSHRAWGTAIRLCTGGSAASNMDRCTVYQALNGDSVVNPGRTCRNFCEHFGLSCANGWDDGSDGCTYGGPGIGCDNVLGAGSVGGPTPDHVCECIDPAPPTLAPSPPTAAPSAEASAAPSVAPSAAPSAGPSAGPSAVPTASRVSNPSPSSQPHGTTSPTLAPASAPTALHTAKPSPALTSMQPSPTPSLLPSPQPSPVPPPSLMPSPPLPSWLPTPQTQVTQQSPTVAPTSTTPLPTYGIQLGTPSPTRAEPQIQYQLTIRSIVFDRLKEDAEKMRSIRQSIKEVTARKLGIMASLIHVVLSKGSVKADVTVNSKPPGDAANAMMDAVRVADTLKSVVTKVKEEIVEKVRVIPNISGVSDGVISAEITKDIEIVTSSPTPVPTQNVDTLDAVVSDSAPTSCSRFWVCATSFFVMIACLCFDPGA
eukprot:TRINITY_DN11664_c1_g2_i2.p1 TRINITY_DN11664_c1_g2~~TRINITY_DN11664_c1_g2_i2.p1  ORF type:complete len:1222 (+),score=147.64 TRINITY_DN11664_c1_g2_i2:88-3753(+)